MESQGETVSRDCKECCHNLTKTGQRVSNEYVNMSSSLLRQERSSQLTSLCTALPDTSHSSPHLPCKKVDHN